MIGFEKRFTLAIALGLMTLTPATAADQSAYGTAITDERPTTDRVIDATAMREAARLARFAAMERPGDEQPVQGTSLSLAEGLEAFAEVANGFHHGGRGDAEYWMRSARNLGHSGRALGEALRSLGHSMGSGPLPAAITGIGAQLAELSWGGRGDASFWMARTKGISERVRGAGDSLRAMAAASTDGQIEVSLATVLLGLSEVAGSTDYSGRGDAEVWMKTTRDFSRIGRATGQGLARCVDGTSGALEIVLRALAVQLKGLSDAGRGNADYWMARTRGLSEQLDGIARSLREIAREL